MDPDCPIRTRIRPPEHKGGIRMSRWIDGIVQSFYSWTEDMVNKYTNVNHDYSSPENDGEDDEDEWETITQVVCGTPIRQTKCLFVPEMNDFYTDEELNTIYHSADEYRVAVDKYGLIYKSQKFQNADTVQKLLDYAKDWVKNNYHGGITNFTITALDMHACGVNVDKYTVGQRVAVQYIDPALHTEISQTLTVISAEYDLNNPENNNYKIGIPDVTLNKVYGETSKSGGGGGGGGKPSDEEDDQTNTELDTVGDNQDKQERDLVEYFANLFYKGPKNDPTEEEAGESFSVGNTEPPGEANPTGDFVYGLNADILNASNLRAKLSNTESLIAQYVKSAGGVDCETVSANMGNVTKVNSDNVKNTDTIETKDLEASNNVTATEKVEGKNVKATQKVEGTDGEFSNTLTVGGIAVATVNDVPSTDTVDVVIDNVRYRLYGRRLS